MKVIRVKPAREVFKFPKFSKASQALTAALEIISTPNRWVRTAMAITTNKFGNKAECGVKSKNAEAFCALGAVRFVNGPAQRSATAFLRRAAYNIRHVADETTNPLMLRDDGIFSVNDNEGLAATKKMFRRAIKAAIKEGK